MARPVRVEYPGALYHVTARGVAQQPIFFDAHDRASFLRLLGRVHEEHGFIVHAYCLMDNHYHLEVETPQANLSRGMQWLGQTYAGFVNRRRGRAGHLFPGRFKAVLVEREGYLYVLTRYIHLNPVRAKLVKHPAQHPWSSYRAYVGATRVQPWLETHATLGAFGQTLEKARLAYRRFVEDQPVTDPFRDVRDGALLGGDAFVRRIQQLVLDRGEGPDASPSRDDTDTPSMDEVVACVRDFYGVSEEQLTTKWRRSNEPRDVAIYLSSRLTGAGLRAVGGHFGGLTAPSVSLASRRVRRRMEQDEEFAERVRVVESLVGQRGGHTFKL